MSQVGSVSELMAPIWPVLSERLASAQYRAFGSMLYKWGHSCCCGSMKQEEMNIDKTLLSCRHILWEILRKSEKCECSALSFLRVSLCLLTTCRNSARLAVFLCVVSSMEPSGHQVQATLCTAIFAAITTKQVKFALLSRLSLTRCQRVLHMRFIIILSLRCWP